MSAVLIVDDSDPAITYSGNWVISPAIGVQTGEYNTSVHQSNTAGDRLSYTFNGTGIAVYGTLNAPGSYGPPSVSFSIDGRTPTAFNSSNSVFVKNSRAITSYVQLYQSPVLTKGTHTLALLSGTPVNAPAYLYVDFLTVSTGSDSVSGTVIVDDRDASIIYVGNWRNAGALSEYGSTTKGAPDDVAGTSITVYGSTGPSNGPNTTAAVGFSIDGGPSSQFNAPESSGDTLHVPFFHAEGLSNIQDHSIVITGLKTSRWWLDCIVYSTQNSSLTGGPVTGGGSTVTGGSGTVAGPQTRASIGGGGPPVGAIAGGVVAGVTALLAIAAIIFMLLRRRKVKANELKSQSVKAGTGSKVDTSPEPFTPPLNGAFTSNPLTNKRPDFNVSNPRIAGGSGGDRMGQPILDPASPESYSGGTSSTYSSVPAMSHYSDGESQQVITPVVAAGPAPGYGHQRLSNPMHPGFDPGAGGITSTYQRDNQQDYDPVTGQQFGQKAQFHGQVIPPVAPAVTTRRGPRPPPSSVPTIEEDSGIRIPARAPPVYTPD